MQASKKTKARLAAAFAMAWVAVAAAAQNGTDWPDKAWRFVMDRSYSPKTHLIYDYLVGDTPDAHVKCLPSPEDIRENFPIPTGWGTGMEDSVLNGAPFLLATLRRHAATRDDESRKTAHLIFDGLCRCAEVSDVRGFLARSISPADGRSHYANSSRDQYTLFVYALWRYWLWPEAADAEKARAAKILVDIARYAERCMTPENDFTLLREDGGPAIVCKMWTDTPGVVQRISGDLADYGGIAPHEALRLPEIYAAAHAVSGDGHWREKELEVADKGIEMSFGPMRRIMNGFALYQMQISIRLLWELERDSARRAKYLALLNHTADATEGFAARLRGDCEELKYDFSASAKDWRTLPMQYLSMGKWTNDKPGPARGMRYILPKHNSLAFHKTNAALRETAEALLILQLCPGRALPKDRVDAFYKVYSSIDYANFHCPCGAVHALLAYWQSRSPLGGERK